MIKPLRKRHLQIWMMLGVVIPCCMTAALLVRPHPVTGELFQPSATAASGEIIRSREKENFKLLLRGREGRETQLEWINKTALKVPTAVIYSTKPGHYNIDGAFLIGRIEARGVYRFSIPTDPAHEYHFIIYDFIHEQITDSINFQP